MFQGCSGPVWESLRGSDSCKTVDWGRSQQISCFLQQKCNVSILLYKLRLGLFSLPCSGPQSQRTQRTHNAIITTGSLQQKTTSATSQKSNWHNSLICMSGATQCKIYVNILNIQDICWYSVFVIHPTIQHGMIGSIHLNIWKGGSAPCFFAHCWSQCPTDTRAPGH